VAGEIGVAPHPSLTSLLLPRLVPDPVKLVPSLSFDRRLGPPGSSGLPAVRGRRRLWQGRNFYEIASRILMASLLTMYVGPGGRCARRAGAEPTPVYYLPFVDLRFPDIAATYDASRAIAHAQALADLGPRVVAVTPRPRPPTISPPSSNPMACPLRSSRSLSPAAAPATWCGHPGGP
jgi:hypothetical protein